MTSTTVRALAGHEYRAAVRSRILVALAAILATVTIASVLTAALQYRGQLADYEAYKAAAKASGLMHVAPLPLAVLSLLRGSLEYLEILGAVIAITLGYLSVSRERSSGTLPLLRSRPITSGQLAAGSALGALGVVATLVGSMAMTSVLALGLIGGSWVTPGQALQLLLTFIAAVLYMMVFYVVGVVATGQARVATTGLLIGLGIWLLVVLVIPQIGDTLDADNQLPGGLFAALGLGHSGEVAVLSHFSFYEHLRNGIEEASLTKHFERFAFAMTDVKPLYRGWPLGRLLGEKRNDIAWMAVYSVAAAAALRASFRRTTSRNSALS